MAVSKHLALGPLGARPRIFNHDILNCTADEVVGNHLYSGRVLGMTEPGDLVQLHPQLRSQWPHIREHYGRIGLAHSGRVIWSVDYGQFLGHPDYLPSVFFFGPEPAATSPDPGWESTVAFINSKNNFMTLAEKLGLDVPKTWCFARPSQVQRPEQFPYPCYLKAAVSVAGVGIFRCADAAELASRLDQFDRDTPVQVQEEIATELFLNLQYRVTDQGLERYAASEQVLDGFTHIGNRYPASHQPWKSVETMAIWLWKRGMRDVFAFDVGVVETPEGTRYRPIECNPRFNGASYPTGVAKKLGAEEWLALNCGTSLRDLQNLNLSGLEFNPKIKKGIALVNWGSILAGKLGVLIAGTRAEQAALRCELERRI
jgi:hypothetical protein